MPRNWIYGVVLLGLLMTPLSVHADAFTDSYQQALHLYEARDYQAALDAFRAAYRQRQLPRILVNMGRAHHRLGQAREALALYEHYLQVEPNPEPKLKADLQIYIAQVKAMMSAPIDGPPAGLPSPATPAPIAPERPVVIAPPAAPVQPPVAAVTPTPLAIEPAPRLTAAPSPAPPHAHALMGLGIPVGVIGLGLLGLGGASVGLDGRCADSLDPCEERYAGRLAGTAELIAGGILFSVGVGMISVSLYHRRRAARAMEARGDDPRRRAPWLALAPGATNRSALVQAP